MKRPVKSHGALFPFLVCLIGAALVYGIVIEPLTGRNQTEGIMTQAAETELPPEESASTPETITEAPPAPTPEPTAAPTKTQAPTNTPAPTDTPAPTEPPTLRQGDKGNAVKELQTRLISLGYLSGSADGDFGRKTAQAVRDFQVCNGLKEDGVFGSACWECINGYSCVAQRTVYVSKRETYHTRENCSGMKHSTKMKLSDAIRKGYKRHNCK